MRDQLLRRLAELERARRDAPKNRLSDATLESWAGRPILDPGGKRIGHVSRVRLDGTGGAWLEVSTDWGVLDWLTGMGAGHPRFTFHSQDVEPRGDGPELVLKMSILDSGELERREAG